MLVPFRAGGPQGIQGPAGVAGAAGAAGPAGPAGPTAWDWADPTYEVAGDQLTIVDPALWTDAGGAFGGAQTIYKAASPAAARCMFVDAGKDNAGLSHVGVYVDGVLISAPAGDFIRAIRVELTRSAFGYISSAGNLNALAVFVDGTTATTTYHGAGIFWNVGDEQLVTVTTTAASWAAAGSYVQRQILYGGITAFDFCIERAGADLNIYYCPTRGRFSRLYTVPGVGVGVGFVGLRFERTGGVITQSALIPAYRESLTSVP